MALVPETAAAALVLAVGLVIGSFLNVCIHRLPLGESVAFPGSRCPRCGTPIRWFQNVPILSWIALRGRCAACRERISWRYPLVEALGGGLLLGLWLAYGPGAAWAVSALLGWMLIVLFFTDLDRGLLPDAVTLTGTALGVGLAWLNPFLGGCGFGRILLSLGGAALGSALLWVIGAVYGRLRGVEAMGMGDVKMMALVGAFSGPRGVLFTLLAASVAGAAVGLAAIPLRGRSLRDTLPFGCFLAPAAFAALLASGRATETYLRLLGLGP
ncbi:MAG: prepilin peptidase [Acidobacteriia bacterium]|nr:prepilin peptidase [Terriglobia bacterium]